MKNILIIRSSTVKQEVESQKNELIEYVKRNSQDDIVVVGGAGASAIKLDQEYLSNLQSVYNLMERGDTVWAWSVDRIGRNEEVMMQFKNRLIAAGVNLRIKEPELTLMDADGNVNGGIELAFSLFCTMAKQEMEGKKKRFARAKKRNKAEGRYNGGKIMFGYSVDSNGYFVVNEETAATVSELFQRYADEPVSCHYLAKDYHSVLNQKNMRFTEIRINRMLKNEAYKGVGYPRLVSDELFQLVQDKLAEYRIKPRFRYKEHPYWCQGLLYEVCDNGETHRMRVKKSEVAYMSYMETFSISINYFDSMVFRLLGDVFSKYDQSAVLGEIRSQNARIRANRSHLETLLEGARKKDLELDEKYFVHGTIGVNNYPLLKKAIQVKIDSYKKEIDGLVEMPEDIEKPSLEGLDEVQVRDMFLKYIQRIYARKIDKWTCKVDIVTSLGNSRPVIYNRKDYTFRFNDSTQWIKIEKLRNIEGRKRT